VFVEVIEDGSIIIQSKMVHSPPIYEDIVFSERIVQELISGSIYSAQIHLLVINYFHWSE